MIARTAAYAAIAGLLAAVAFHVGGNDAAAEWWGDFTFFAGLAACAATLLEMRPLPADPPVLIVTQDDLAVFSGYSRRIGFIADSARRLGLEVVVIGFASRDPAIRAHTLHGAGIRGRLRALALGLDFAFRRRPRTVVLTSVGAPYHALYAIALTALGCRVVYDCHDPVVEIWGEIFSHDRRLMALHPWIVAMERLMDRVASRTIVPSRATEEQLHLRGWRGPIARVYNVHGIADPGMPGPAPLVLRSLEGWQDATIVQYVGGLQRGLRGLEDQFAALALARAQGVNVRFVVIGFGDEAYVRQLARPLQRDDAVRIFTAMPPGPLRALSAQCDVAISSEAIGYGVQSKFFEALDQGIRVVAIDDGRVLSTLFGDLLTYYDGSPSDLARVLAERPRPLTELERIRAREILQRLVHESIDGIAISFSQEPATT